MKDDLLTRAMEALREVVRAANSEYSIRLSPRWLSHAEHQLWELEREIKRDVP
jgi:hypothetical protein